jgi:hypothetical protein
MLESWKAHGLLRVLVLELVLGVGAGCWCWVLVRVLVLVLTWVQVGVRVLVLTRVRVLVLYLYCVHLLFFVVEWVTLFVRRVNFQFVVFCQLHPFKKNKTGTDDDSCTSGSISRCAPGPSTVVVVSMLPVRQASRKHAKF